MDNATLIFETLLRKGVFMDKVDSYVQSISDNNIPKYFIPIRIFH